METMFEEVSDLRLRHMVLQNEGFNSMATSSEEKPVWIGYMDIVPVTGTVKEAVELVLAIYEGNEVVVKEKEKAIENIVQESSIRKFTCPDKSAKAEAAAPAFSELKNVSEATKENVVEDMAKFSKNGAKFTCPDKSAKAEAAAPAFSELKNVSEATKGNIANCMAKVSKNETKISQSEQKKRDKEKEKKLESIKQDMLKKIQTIDPEFYQDLTKELKRSKKGEHVFNNGILKFHSKVLKKFIEYLKAQQRGYDQKVMDNLGKNTLPINTATEVQKKMKVDFDEKEFYVNANAVLYGYFSQTLSDAMLDVLNHTNLDDVKEEEKDRVNSVIDKMNEFEIYVDHMAKEKWINKRRRQERFDDVKRKVAMMYSTDRGLNWCFDILREVELFNSRQ